MGIGSSKHNQKQTHADKKAACGREKNEQFAKIAAGSERKDRSYYVQSGKNGEKITREPGDLNGNQFNCDTLKNCEVLVTDLCDSMMVDNCENCKFTLAAIRGSIFVRTCKNCKFVMVCGQFRCVNCFDCDFFMHSKTGPVVESSKNVRIGCASLHYPELKRHMEIAMIDRFSNLWPDVHDFTPGNGNFEVANGAKIDASADELEKSYVPFLLMRKSGKKYYVVKLSIDRQDEAVRLSNQHSVFVGMEKSHDGQTLFCTVEAKSKEDAESLFSALNPIEIKSTTD